MGWLNKRKRLLIWHLTTDCTGRVLSLSLPFSCYPVLLSSCYPVILIPRRGALLYSIFSSHLFSGVFQQWSQWSYFGYLICLDFKLRLNQMIDLRYSCMIAYSFIRWYLKEHLWLWRREKNMENIVNISILLNTFFYTWRVSVFRT